MAHTLLLLPSIFICLLLQIINPTIAAFQVHHSLGATKKCSTLNLNSFKADCCPRLPSSALHNTNGNNDAPPTTTEAEKLMAKAKAIRESIPISTNEPKSTSLNQETKVNKILSEFSLPQQSLDDDSNNYRIYLDIGREKGTWMDPRWGARYLCF